MMFHLQTSAARVIDPHYLTVFAKKSCKLFCLVIALLSVCCDNTAFPVKSDAPRNIEGRFSGGNNARLVVVFTVEKNRLTMFNYLFYDDAGSGCRSGFRVGSTAEPIARIQNNEFTLSLANDLVFRGNFSTNDTCDGTWEASPNNMTCYGSSGKWAVTRS